MNLEQIKQKQLGLNELLQLHLNDLESVINRITGSGSLEESDKVNEATSGLVGEIYLEQKNLERKLDKLCNLKQRLYNSTYEPTDTCLPSN